MTTTSSYLTQPTKKYNYVPRPLPTGALNQISNIPGAAPRGAAPSVLQTISQRTQGYSTPNVAKPQQQQVTPLEAYQDKLKSRIASTTEHTAKIKSGLKTKSAQRINTQQSQGIQQARNYASSGGRTRGSWGGYSNGQIPVQAMARISSGQYMRPDAASAFNTMNAAFQQAFGRPISVTDGYRTLSSQQRLAITKPGLAATPGTSNHGWGVALDLGGGINRHGTAEHNWMVQNAGRFGYGSLTGNMYRKEPWHWEYRG